LRQSFPYISIRCARFAFAAWKGIAFSRRKAIIARSSAPVRHELMITQFPDV
jgi:hypothetical protein